MQVESTPRRDPREDPLQGDRTKDEEQQEDGCRHDPARRKDDRDDQDGGQRSPDIWDERSHQGDHRKGPGKRHAEHQHDDARKERVGDGHEGGPPDVAADLVERASPSVHQGVTSPPIGRSKEPVPGLVAVHQQEEGQEPAQDGDRHRVCRRRDEVVEPAQDQAPDRVRDPLHEPGELGRDAQRCQLGPSGLDPGIEGRDDGTQRGDHRDDHRRDDGTEDEEGREHDHAGCLGGAPASRTPLGHVRCQRRGKDQPKDDRCGYGRELPGDPEQDHAQRERDQHPPADRGQAHQPAGHQRVIDRRGAAALVNHARMPRWHSWSS